jgi:hypothetical protein
MKLRIQRNSVRLRLGRSEVDRLLQTGRLQEHVSFGPESAHRLCYTLELSETEPEISAAFDCTNLRIILPTRVAGQWAGSDDVGIEAALDVGGGVSGERLQVLIEKDFACLDHPEDNADAYPHPARVNTCRSPATP